jgi:hypothetical protein
MKTRVRSNQNKSEYSLGRDAIEALDLAKSLYVHTCAKFVANLYRNRDPLCAFTEYFSLFGVSNVQKFE